jgi:dipicolinate synthase subunit A
MKNKMKIACLGGDGRCLSMAARLAVLGADVYTWGMGEGESRGVTQAFSLDAALQGVAAVVLPMPAFDGEGRVFCPLAKNVVAPDAGGLFSMIGGGVPVIGGRITPAVWETAKACGVHLYDYAEREDFKIRNAVPTAEGAICLVMQALDRTLSGSHVAILGYGCIGAALAERLKHLGAHVTVAARKTRDVARIECAGLRAIHLTGEGSLRPLTAGYDIIFNTVPYRLLTSKLLTSMPEKTLLVELASAPGGWDSTLTLPCRAIYAPGIPGKHVPTTAGIIIAQTIDTILKEVDLT